MPCQGRTSGPEGAQITPGPGWATLHLPEPSQSDGDGLGSDLTHPLPLSAWAQVVIGNTAEVAIRPRYPNPLQHVGRRGRHGQRIAPTTGRPTALADASQTPVENQAHTARSVSMHL